MADTCQTADCDRTDLVARGLCSACYQRAKYQGKLDAAAPNPSKECAHCGEPVPPGRRWGAKFCSPDCKEAAHTRQQHDLIVAAHAAKARSCAWCSEPLDPERRDGTRFCSPTCGTAWANHQRSIEMKKAVATVRPPCATCGGPIPPNRRSTAVFCSADCKSKSRRNAHPVKRRERKGENLRSLYGIGLAEYEAMFDAQDGRCAICCTDAPTGKGGTLHVDHCHATGVIRSLLCINCNNGLGKFRDDPALLRAAADYLERHALT